ncbi:MAG: FtsX-like permease family protein, partial [Chloroflexota bacterium]
ENGGSIATSQFVVTYVVDPATYPAIGEVRVIEPVGATLESLYTEGSPDIVVSENMASSFGLSVGDEVRVARTDTLFTVRGIVGAEAEAGISNPFAAFFGFAYFDIDDVRRIIDPGVGYNRISIAFPEAPTEEEARAQRRALVRATGFQFPDTDIDSAVNALAAREEISIALGDFIVTLGLGALLIGGVGILNTMLVLVRRRTNEIAALKTFGLKGRQIALLFFAESLLLGLIGSVIGCIAGVLLGGFVNQFGEQFINQDLAWRIYPEALIYGMSLGMATTIIFGIAPILTALQIRPATVLRPNEGQFARLGLLQTFGLMILITLLLGLIVGQIVQPTFGLVSSFTPQDAYLWSIIGVAITLLILGLLTGVLWVFVWLIGKLPAFGWVDLQLALRNLSAQRTRTATTLLALSAGMFALSSITFVSEGTRQLLNDLLSQSFGGNVLAIPLQPAFDERLSDLAVRNYASALEDVEGIEGSTVISLYDTELFAIDGVRVEDPDFDEVNPLDGTTTAPLQWQNATSWDTDNDAILDNAFTIVQGRNLTLADEGQRLLIGSADSAAVLGISVGSELTYSVGGQRVNFTVIGLYSSGSLLANAGVVFAPSSVDGILNPQFQFFSFEVAPDSVTAAVSELSGVIVPQTVALDVAFIDSLVGRFLQQFIAIPTIVGVLSLFAAAVIMANTIALSTLERRRQIGILKAIGLKSNRVLFVMLIESTIIGLLSALLGIGLSWAGLAIFTEITGQVIPLPTEARLVAILLVLAAMGIAAGSTFLSANVAVRERVMNVLRYE